jgi:hypothetical protein
MTTTEEHEEYMGRFAGWREIMGGLKREEELAKKISAFDAGASSGAASQSQQNGDAEGEVVNNLVVRKGGKGKKRVGLTSVSGGTGASGPSNFGRRSGGGMDNIPSSSSAAPNNMAAPHANAFGSIMGLSPLTAMAPSAPVSTIGFGLPSAPGAGMGGGFDPHAAFENRMMGGGQISPTYGGGGMFGQNPAESFGFGGGAGGGEDVPMVDVLPGLDSSPVRPSAGAVVPVRPRTLGGDREREKGRRVEPLHNDGGLQLANRVSGMGAGGMGGGQQVVLPTPVLKNLVTASAGGDEVAEGVNDSRGGTLLLIHLGLSVS